MDEKSLDSPDGDDVPSDFFDDFNREDFVEGLSVIDSWDDNNADVKHQSDSNELGVEKDHDQSKLDSQHRDRGKEELRCEKEGKYTPRHESSRRFTSKNNLDDYIKPGSRRDPNKTKEAIRRDKEVKVKEHLAKRLDSAYDIRPPGTELDDYFNIEKKSKYVDEKTYTKSNRSRSKERKRRSSLRLRSSRYEDRKKNRQRSPYSPHSPKRYRSRNWEPSPGRNLRRDSPHRAYRHYSPRRSRHSRSPGYRSSLKSYRSPSPAYTKDNFLYPKTFEPVEYVPNISYQMDSGYTGAASYSGAQTNEFSIPSSSYIENQTYTSGYNAYPEQLVQPTMSDPLQVSASVNPVPAPLVNLGPPPPMVPAPSVVSSANASIKNNNMDKTSPYDALAQLVADGKLSQADYLKLAPNKGGTALMDDKTRVMVLSRCDEAIGKLNKLFLPCNLFINNNMLHPEPKSITSKYSSPLKRQPVVEFNFTKPSSSLIPQKNKQLLESIIASIGLEQVSKIKKMNKNMKNVAVQTTKPYCDVCEIRESTNNCNVSTSIDAEHFSSTVYTQVLEQDLINSKSIFNPSGSVSASEPISIAHLTPAQLVSQLAARAKTLKQTETMQPSYQFGRRNQPNNYVGRGSQQYNYENYHY